MLKPEINDNEHIEPKSSVKSVASDQIKRACQNSWGGGGSPPGPSLCYDTEMCSPHRGFVISRVFSTCLDYGWSQENRSPRTSSYLYYSNKFMHGFVKFLIVLLRSLLLCFCTVFNVKTIQYNAIHKFVGVLDNPPRLMLSEGWNAIAETL